MNGAIRIGKIKAHDLSSLRKTFEDSIDQIGYLSVDLWLTLMPSYTSLSVAHSYLIVQNNPHWSFRLHYGASWRTKLAQKDLSLTYQAS